MGSSRSVCGWKGDWAGHQIQHSFSINLVTPAPPTQQLSAAGGKRHSCDLDPEQRALMLLWKCQKRLLLRMPLTELPHPQGSETTCSDTHRTAKGRRRLFPGTVPALLSCCLSCCGSPVLANSPAGENATRYSQILTVQPKEKKGQRWAGQEVLQGERQGAGGRMCSPGSPGAAAHFPAACYRG